MREKWMRFMQGRYGQDNLGRFLLISAVVCLLASTLTRWVVLSWFSIGLLGWGYFRMLSRNPTRRRQENNLYLEGKQALLQRIARLRTRWDERKTYRYFHCPHCRQTLRVPKGRGKISITCPKCHTEFIKKS